MIVVKLQGGLGNQLFQYATARALALFHKTDVAFDTRLLQDTGTSSLITPRRYELDKLGIELVPPTLLDQLTYGLGPVPVGQKLQKGIRRVRNARMYAEKSPACDPEIFQTTTSRTYLKGFFQSEAYFKSIRPLLLQELQLTPPENPWTDRIREAAGVSLHVRRGDYLTNAAARVFHGVCPPEYYSKALAYLYARLGEVPVFVFSDDIAWAKAHIVGPFPLTFVEHTSPNANYTDLCLMSLCQHHIIANSSFSWWGAWLNPSPDKTVIAPQRWFADATAQRQATDLLPASWLQLA